MKKLYLQDNTKHLTMVFSLLKWEPHHILNISWIIFFLVLRPFHI